jgi:hypothetical protein
MKLDASWCPAPRGAMMWSSSRKRAAPALGPWPHSSRLLVNMHALSLSALKLYKSYIKVL